MKKVFLFIVLVALFTTTATNTIAQNRCVLKNDKGSRTLITSSDRTVTCHQDGPLTSITSLPEVKPKAKGTAPTHTLNVYPPTGWDGIFVSNHIDVSISFYPDMGDHLSVQLEEGTYYILVQGVNSENELFGWIWTNDSLIFDEDTNIYPDFNECIYDISVDFVDENGNSFNDMEFNSVSYYPELIWLDLCEGDMVSGSFAFAIEGVEYIEQLPVRYNGFDEKSYLYLYAWLEPGDNKTYFIQCPTIIGMHESQHFTVRADDLIVIEETFTAKNGYDNCWYSTEVCHIQNENGMWGAWSVIFHMANRFDSSKPYTVVSNARNYGVNNYETRPKTIIRPCILDGYDYNNVEDDPIYNGIIRTSLYLDADGNVVREAMPQFKEGSYHSSYPNFFPETPAKKITPSDKMTFFGERTPLAHYNPEAFNINHNTPFGQTYFSGRFLFSGEQTCERTCDNDSFIHVWIGGEEAYNNSVIQFNYNGNLFRLEPNEPTDVVIEVNNDHLFANGVPKTNVTRVEFDLGRDDAMPPTMTFLRVLDGNGDETICHNRLSLSTLVFGCADFTWNWTEQFGGAYEHLLYNDKPEVEVLYSIDGEIWEPLAFVEDESLFHVDYGNVFVADLGQLENRALDKWVSLKFTLTDEAGNTQTQTMENVFYAGEMISVNEHVTESLQHQVYPNPFTNKVKITAAQAVEGEANIAVYNVLGEQVYSKAENCTETKEFTIDGSAWKSGVYFYSINTESGLLQGKIVKK
jgi:hypothetical protein